MTPHGRGAEAAAARETTPAMLRALEDYFGTPYPFAKLDSVTIPATVSFGAMENAGMITYQSTLMLARLLRGHRRSSGAAMGGSRRRTRSRTSGSATS